MILLVDESNRTIAEKYLDKPNPFACRILSQLLAYGTGERFLEHWVQLEGDKPTAAISRIDGNMTVFCEKANEELTEFINAVGFGTILADKHVFPQYWSGEAVMRLACKAEIKATEGNGTEIEQNPTIREVYSVLERCMGAGFEVPDFDSFYPDMSHRVRHGLARIFALRVGGQAVACCMTSAETNSCAIVSGVATLPKMRGKGYAGKLITEMIKTLGDKEVFVFCREDLISFYSKLGFKLMK